MARVEQWGTMEDEGEIKVTICKPGHAWNYKSITAPAGWLSEWSSMDHVTSDTYKPKDGRKHKPDGGNK